MLRITEVRVSLRDDAKLKAFASITLEDCFVIRGLKVIEGNNNRMFVAMPSRKRPDGKHQDLAHPIKKEMRQLIEDVVIGEYQREKGRGVRAGVLDESEMYAD
ncbi:MAG: septation protein SpoVG family protein [Candidatus Eiseniibacteriota bacterium]|jgi:stage V sporulation protein G